MGCGWLLRYSYPLIMLLKHYLLIYLYKIYCAIFSILCVDYYFRFFKTKKQLISLVFLLFISFVHIFFLYLIVEVFLCENHFFNRKYIYLYLINIHKYMRISIIFVKNSPIEDGTGADRVFILRAGSEGLVPTPSCYHPQREAIFMYLFIIF